MNQKLYFQLRGLKPVLAALFCFLSSTQALGGADFSIIESNQFRVLSAEECRAEQVDISYDNILQQLLASIAIASQNQPPGSSWVPAGDVAKPEPVGCEPQDVEKAFITNRADLNAQAAAIDSLFTRCDQGLRTDATKGAILTGPLALAHAGAIRYQFCDHPNIRKVAMRLSTGEIVRGALALKPGTTSRPLVIAKCGMLCNTGDSGMSQLLMHLFDESPFNVLVLANNTGPDYVRDNSVFVPGGFKEGQQIVQVAEVLRASPLNARISSLHVVGLSLGGHASLYASYLNGLNLPTPSGISSTLAACPAVDLKTAIADTFTFDIKGIAISFLYDSAIDRSLNQRPDLATFFQWRYANAGVKIDQIGDLAAWQFLTQKVKAPLQPFSQVSIKTRDEFWKQNHFATYAAQPQAGKTLALASLDDEVVDPQTNIKTLSGSSVATAITPSGDHCAWSEFYGWRISSALFRGFVLSQSPEMLTRQRLHRANIPENLLASANNVDGKKGVHQMVRYTFATGKDGMFITYNLATDCGDSKCSRETQFFLRFSHFDKPANLPANLLTNTSVNNSPPSTSPQTRPWWAHAPVNEAEAESLTRWANVNLKAVGKNAYLIDGTKNDPVAFVWLGYDDES